MLSGLTIIALLVVALAVYIRAVPSDPDRWHVDPGIAREPGVAGVLMRVPDVGADGLARFEAAVLAEPRVTRLAGAPEQGRVTYVARSQVMGFPDYVTAALEGPDLVVLSRLRFGRSDLGVNRARLERVFQRMKAGE